MAPFQIRLAKESFKFSSTHFTVFSADSAERLHGHNYQVAVECEISTLGEFAMGFEFNTLKPLIKALCESWDERVLIARRSRYLRISDENIRNEPHWVIDFQSRSYRLPKNEAVLLETENVTSEELARIFAIELTASWRKALALGDDLGTRLASLTVSIEETRGQRASYTLNAPLKNSASEVL